MTLSLVAQTPPALIACEGDDGCTAQILAETLPLRGRRRCQECEVQFCWRLAFGANGQVMTPFQRIEVRDALNRCRFFLDMIEDQLATEEQVGLLAAVMGDGPVARQVNADIREHAMTMMAVQKIDHIPGPIGFIAETREQMLARWESEDRIDPACEGCRPFYDAPDPLSVHAPAHKASDGCESGKRAHCSCSTCF